MIEISVKSFAQLSVQELYALLSLRAQVFVVEQECPYQDIDNKDPEALHVLGYEGDDLVAYTRILKHQDGESVSFGRVATAKQVRGKGYGKAITAKTIATIEARYPQSMIKISAQLYLTKFYQAFGFTTQGEEYQEDWIPHIMMVRQ